MTLNTLMQAGPAKANDLFARLSETSDGAVKTRERLFAELKSELELHVDLEEQHLFPILKRHAETRDLVASAIKDNKDLRARLDEIEGLPKNHETFLEKLAELKKTFRQHARDEKKELLPAVQRALSEEQVQGIAEKIETGQAEADQARQDQAEEKRALARREREQAELEAQQNEAAEQERIAAERHTREVARQGAETVLRTAETARRVTRDVTEGAQRLAAAPLSTGFYFWDLMLGMRGTQQEVGRGTVAHGPAAGNLSDTDQVIPLAEETLIVGKRVVNNGTTRVRRYVVETPVEQQVSLYDEKVVVERRRPVTDAATGETLTELTIEVVETSEVPVVGKSVRVREEVVVRRERTRRTATVRDTVRRDEVEIEQPRKNRAVRADVRS